MLLPVGKSSGERTLFQERQAPPVWAHLSFLPFSFFSFVKVVLGVNWYFLPVKDEGFLDTFVLCPSCSPVCPGTPVLFHWVHKLRTVFLRCYLSFQSHSLMSVQVELFRGSLTCDHTTD